MMAGYYIKKLAIPRGTASLYVNDKEGCLYYPPQNYLIFNHLH